MDYNKIYNQIKERDRRSVYRAMNDICHFLIDNDINLFGISQLEYNVSGELNFNKPITIITEKSNDFFIKFFKSLHYKYKKTKNKVFFSLPTKKRYHYIYQLNLHPVLIIYFSKPLSLLASLCHLYFEYTLPYNYSQKWHQWFKIEDSFLKKHNTKDVKVLDDCVDYIGSYVELFEYFSDNKDIIITGKHAYDLVFETTYFFDQPIEIIVSSYTVIKELIDKFSFEVKKIEKEEISYFYGQYEMLLENEVIVRVFQYSRLVNYIELGKLTLSNIHGIFFHLLYESLNNIDYICDAIPKIDLENNKFKIFQINYRENFARNILQSKVNAMFKKKIYDIL